MSPDGPHRPGIAFPTVHCPPLLISPWMDWRREIVVPAHGFGGGVDIARGDDRWGQGDCPIAKALRERMQFGASRLDLVLMGNCVSHGAVLYFKDNAREHRKFR